MSDLKHSMTTLREMLALQGGGVISIVGGGGKTTLMFALAREIAAAGETVLTTTTTKILIPRAEQSSKIIIATDIKDVLRQAKPLLHEHRHLTAGHTCIPSQDKLAGFSAGDIGNLLKSGLFRWILVEADGAAHRPLKAPAGHEPVIPGCSRWVIAVAGLDAIGQPLTEDWVFRSAIYGEITGLSFGERITEQSVAMVLSHEKGIMKGNPPGALRYVFLNKADTKERKKAGRRIALLLREGDGIRPDRVIIGSIEGDSCLEVSMTQKHPTAGIVLAAGMSTRMGKTKQMMEVGGKPLLAWVVGAALASELGKVVLVLGHEAKKVTAALGSLGRSERLQIVVNKKFREGMAGSLHAGLLQVKDQYPSVMFLLGDQPLMGADTINLLLRRFRGSDKDICVPVCGEKQGNPVCFSSLFYDRILGIRGDTGAREVVRSHPDHVLSVEIADASCFLDIDSAADAERLFAP